MSDQHDEEMPRPRLFVVRHSEGQHGPSFTIAEEVAHIGPPQTHGEGDELQRALHDSLDHLFRHGALGGAQVLPFPAERDPQGGWQIFGSVKKPKGPPGRP